MTEIVWRPTPEQIAAANLTRLMARAGVADYPTLYRRSIEDPRWFWDACARDLGVEWFEPYREVLDDSRGFPWCRWFVGARVNLTHNCLDRHADTRRDHPALVWEGESGESRTVTYGELVEAVARLAAAFRRLGLEAGDVAGLYLPMVPEVVVALLALWKVGMAGVPIFSGFGADALAVRLRDCGAKLLLTADAGFRRGGRVPLKEVADEALRQAPSVRHALVLRRTDAPIPWTEGRDLDWAETVAAEPQGSATARLDSEARALVIYTSGTTGKPKGTVHTHGGLIASVPRELAYYFDLKPEDRFFWLTDIGWMMGAWEIIGVLFQGATLGLYEGAPNWPAPDRLWRLVERQRLTHLGISPTAVRLLAAAGPEWIDAHALDSLRVLGSTGEPWDAESFLWYFRRVGRGRCPVINISGGTELMGCLLTSSPIDPITPCGFRGPGLGMDVDVVDELGEPVRGAVGYLVCRRPSPSMTRGFLNDSERYLETYFSRWPDVWFHGDWASVDADGFWFIHGRADDTIKVAGKRTGPAEIEAALIAHPEVAEAAAVGVPDPIRGEAVVCFVVVRAGAERPADLAAELGAAVVRALGKTLRPERIHFVAALPKTRSGKIVRGAIKRHYLAQPPGDTSSVENPEALSAIPRRA